jgi:hypothetical protein
MEIDIQMAEPTSNANANANGNIEMNESNDFHHNLLNKIDEIKNKLTDKEYKDLVDILQKKYKIDNEKNDDDSNNNVDKVVIELELMYVDFEISDDCCNDGIDVPEDVEEVYSLFRFPDIQRKTIQEEVTVEEFIQLSTEVNNSRSRGFCMLLDWRYDDFEYERETEEDVDELDNCVEYFKTVYNNKMYSGMPLPVYCLSVKLVSATAVAAN